MLCVSIIIKISPKSCFLPRKVIKCICPDTGIPVLTTTAPLRPLLIAAMPAAAPRATYELCRQALEEDQ